MENRNDLRFIQILTGDLTWCLLSLNFSSFVFSLFMKDFMPLLVNIENKTIIKLFISVIMEVLVRTLIQLGFYLLKS